MKREWGSFSSVAIKLGLASTLGQDAVLCAIRFSLFLCLFFLFFSFSTLPLLVVHVERGGVAYENDSNLLI